VSRFSKALQGLALRPFVRGGKQYTIHVKYGGRQSLQMNRASRTDRRDVHQLITSMAVTSGHADPASGAMGCSRSLEVVRAGSRHGISEARFIEEILCIIRQNSLAAWSASASEQKLNRARYNHLFVSISKPQFPGRSRYSETSVIMNPISSLLELRIMSWSDVILAPSRPKHLTGFASWMDRNSDHTATNR